MEKDNTLKELKRLLDILTQGEKVKGLKLSLYDVKELIYVYNELTTKGESETINSKVNDVCLYCGIKTKTKGTGYQILNRPSF